MKSQDLANAASAAHCNIATPMLEGQNPSCLGAKRPALSSGMTKMLVGRDLATGVRPRADIYEEGVCIRPLHPDPEVAIRCCGSPVDPGAGAR